MDPSSAQEQQASRVQNYFASTSSQSLLENIQKGIFLYAPTKDNKLEEKSNPSRIFQSRQSFKSNEENYQHKSNDSITELIQSQQKPSQLPQLLDINKTQQTRSKQFILKNTIQSTIQQLLRIYKQKSNLNNSLLQKQAQNQIFQRIAYIFSEMNEFNGQIQNAISYLNQGGGYESFEKQATPLKKLNVSHVKLPSISQSDGESYMNQENQYKREDKNDADQNVHASLGQRFHKKFSEKMQPEN